MFAKVVICVVAAVWVADAQNFTTIRENNWPYDLTTPFSYRTLAPIDIDTSSARLINTGSPLKLVIGQREAHVVKNTGYAISVLAAQPIVTSITGGILGKDVYVFQNLTFFVAGDYRKAASNSIDDTDSPLQAIAAFRNMKYPTFKSALNKRDGMAIININVNVEGYAPNPLFTPFANILAKIRVSGSTVISPSLPLFQWFDQILTIQHYYAYPGSYIDIGSVYSPHYDCATVIQFPKSAAFYISITQYAYFQRLLNPQGNQLTIVQSTYPRGCRPVVQACGEVQFVLPTTSG